MARRSFVGGTANPWGCLGFFRNSGVHFLIFVGGTAKNAWLNEVLDFRWVAPGQTPKWALKDNR